MLRLIVPALVIVLGFASAAQADNKEKIVGDWEVVKGQLPEGTVVKFTKDGKVETEIEVDGNKVKISGTYTVDGAKLNLKVKFMDQEMEDSGTIKELTDTKAVLENKDGQATELKKVKK